VGQTSEGLGASQSTPYKSEVLVKLVPKQLRADDSYVYAAKVKRELQQVLVGAKIKTTPIGMLGTADRAPLALVVTGSDLDSAMVFANAAMDELKKIKGATEIKLTVECRLTAIKWRHSDSPCKRLV
jgi:HAE1 family hydrophobic/amphiphilic exporter-1